MWSDGAAVARTLGFGRGCWRGAFGGGAVNARSCFAGGRVPVGVLYGQCRQVYGSFNSCSTPGQQDPAFGLVDVCFKGAALVLPLNGVWATELPLLECCKCLCLGYLLACRTYLPGSSLHHTNLQTVPARTHGSSVKGSCADPVEQAYGDKRPATLPGKVKPRVLGGLSRQSKPYCGKETDGRASCQQRSSRY